MNADEAAEGLRRGDFTRLAPLFGDAARPDVAEGTMLEWIEAGKFRGDPDILAEALTCACFLGQTGIAFRLLRLGVDPNGGKGTGLDAVHWAANRGQLGAVELLIAADADLERRSSYDATALGTAVWAARHEPRGDQVGVIRTLLAAGADPTEAEFPSGIAEVDALLARPER